MKTHSDKGRLLVSQAILQSKLNIGSDLKDKALNCIIAYTDKTITT